MAELKLERNEIVALLLVFFLSLGLGHFPGKETLPEFSVAIALQQEQPVQLHISAARYLEGAYASALGLPESSPTAIVPFLLFFPPLLLALTALFLYLSCRALGFGRSVSAFCAVLFASSFVSFQFLPGAYSASQLAAPVFALFLFHLAMFVSKNRMLALVPAAAFAALAAYLSPSFGIACAIVAAAFAIHEFGKKEGRLAYFALLLVLSAAAAYLSPEKQSLYFSVQNLAASYSAAPFLLAAASLSFFLFFFSRARPQFAILSAAGALMFGFSPAAATILLAFSAAEGATAVLSAGLPKSALLFCAFALAFFALLGMVPQADFYKTIAISALLALLFPALLHLYDYKNAGVFSAFLLSLAALSLFSAALYPLSPQKPMYPSYLDTDLSGAFSFLSQKQFQTLYILGSADAAKFYSPSSSLGSPQELSSFLVSGKPLLAKGSAFVLSLSDIDDGYSLYQNGTPQFATYKFISNFSSGGASYAVFASSSSGALLYELDSFGALALKDPLLVDSFGRQIATVPLSRAIVLSPSKPFYSPQNRLLLLEEGAKIPYFVELYSGEAPGAAKVSELGKVTVFEVN